MFRSDRSVPARIVEHRSRNAYTVLRLIAFVAVGAGVVWAAMAGVNQLRTRHAVLEQQIVELEQQEPSSGSAAAAQLEGLRRERLLPANFGWLRLGLAAVVYAVALLASAFFWHDCLRAFEQPVSRPITVAAHIFGGIGKYVPGKAMVIVLRSSAVARHSGVSRIPAAIGVFVETLTMMACGATIAGLAVLWVPAPSWVRGLAGLLVLAAATPTLPPLFRRVLHLLARGRFGHHAAVSIDHYHWKLMARGWIWMTIVWLLIGGSFWLVVDATPGAAAGVSGGRGYATATATIALAMVAGFLSLIPGGAGVRELVITTVLAPLAGTGPAMVAAVIARLLYLAVEGLAAALAWAYLRAAEVPAGARPVGHRID